jgi:hypothetical protein
MTKFLVTKFFIWGGHLRVLSSFDITLILPAGKRQEVYSPTPLGKIK